MGNTAYELSNYLGNVQNVISNRFIVESEPFYEEQFDTDVFNGFTDWSLTGNASSTGGSACNYGSSSSMSKPFTLTASAAYVLEFDLSINSGSITLEITDGNGVVSSVSVGSGSQAISFVPTTSNITVTWKADGNSNTYCIDNIALEEKTGNKLAEVLQYTDYYPYGMPMPGRNGTGGINYRYAFNGMETNPEMSGAAGNSYDYELRILDSRLGRWFSRDPYNQFMSPYCSMANSPIAAYDADGGYVFIVNDENGFMRKIINALYSTNIGKEYLSAFIDNPSNHIFISGIGGEAKATITTSQGETLINHGLTYTVNDYNFIKLIAPSSVYDKNGGVKSFDQFNFINTEELMNGSISMIVIPFVNGFSNDIETKYLIKVTGHEVIAHAFMKQFLCIMEAMEHHKKYEDDKQETTNKTLEEELSNSVKYLDLNVQNSELQSIELVIDEFALKNNPSLVRIDMLFSTSSMDMNTMKNILNPNKSSAEGGGSDSGENVSRHHTVRWL